MARGKVEITRIHNDVTRRKTFAKRRAGLLKKAEELAVLCDARLGVILFSDAGQPYHYCSHHTSYYWSELIKRYETITNAQLQETDDDDDQQMFMDVTTTKAWLHETNHDDDQEMSMEQMFTEIAALRHEHDRLEASLRRQTGEDLPLPSGATKEEFDNLEQQVELALGKVRETKDKLLDQQLDESHHKVHILEDQYSFLRRKMTEDGQRRAAGEASAVVAEGMATAVLPFGGFFPEVEENLSMSLQLWP